MGYVRRRTKEIEVRYSKLGFPFEFWTDRCAMEIFRAIDEWTSPEDYIPKKIAHDAIRREVVNSIARAESREGRGTGELLRRMMNPTREEKWAKGSERAWHGYVYIHFDHGLFKIGSAKNPEARYSTYRTYNPWIVRIREYGPLGDSYTEVERALHQMYQEFNRKQPEWFAISPKHVLDIDRWVRGIFGYQRIHVFPYVRRLRTGHSIA